MVLAKAVVSFRSRSMRVLAFTFAAFAIAFCSGGSAQAQSVTFAGPEPSVNFGSVNVCPAGKTSPAPCSKTETLSYNVSSGTTIGSIEILTTGDPNLDFKAKASDTSTTLCKAQSYASAVTCTVDVTFAPLAPGQRKGAVQILGQNGKILATTNIYGAGTGPQIVFSPSPYIHLPGLTSASGVAVDASGNLFVCDYEANTVKEILAAGGYTTVKTLASGATGCYALALDGSGNLFLVNNGQPQQLQEIPALGDYTTVNNLTGALGTPSGVAVDGSGNVFVSEASAGDVKEFLASSGYSTFNTIGSDFNLAQGVALDASGNLFLVETNGGTVKEIFAAGGYTTVNTLLSDLFQPYAVQWMRARTSM